jgi:serine/threonine protein phosphatase PrpC
MRIEAHAWSDVGDRRVNEDAWRIEIGDDEALLAVADGLGGHAGGDRAAKCCLDSIADSFARNSELTDTGLQTWANTADRAVAAVRTDAASPATSMRTTLALFAIREGVARSLHVGDSRAYWFRDGRLKAKTRDHTVAQLVESAPAAAGLAPLDPADRNRVLRAIGAGTGVSADLGEAARLEPGDALLLCTDGLWSLIDEQLMVQSLAEAATPAQWAALLARRAQTDGSGPSSPPRDNITAICAMVAPEPAISES